MTWRADFFAFRVPALPFATLEGIDDERLTALAARPEVAEALAVASPDLAERLRTHPGDAAARRALLRYVTRMATRPTPFGLFAAHGTGSIADRTRIALPDPARWRRHTRLDGELLDRVARSRADALRRRMVFRPNPTLHRVGGRLRFVQTRIDGEERTHHLAELRDSPQVHCALAGGAESLIEAQALVGDLALAVTGPPSLDALIDDLDALGDDETVATLRGIRAELAALDAGRDAGRLDEGVRALGVPAAPDRRLQVDLTVPAGGATLGRDVVDDVVRGVELLRRFARPRTTDLDRFRAAFAERYEEREVPLLEALDADLGVGFGAGGDPAPLLKGLARPQPDRQLPIGRREQRLLALLERAWAQGAQEVVLTAADVAALAAPDPPELPAALAAMASVARTAEGPRTVLHFATGPSGARLLGRFCHADAELAERVRDHVRAEEALDPEAIHAEVVHLPAGRMANIVARPLLREWELEWLGRSGAPADRRLQASDLLVSLRRGRFVLRSRRLGRRVVPRLSCAHNFDRRSPAVYRFLAAVQADGVAGDLAWSWGPFTDAAFTPRVRSGRIVLAPATWRVDPAGLAGTAALEAWRTRLRVPRWVCLAEGDNRLALDLDNPLCAETLLRRREAVVLEELLPGPDQLVANAPDGARAVELVIPLVAERAPARLPVPPPAGAVRRTFGPGSEWTTLKLYTGTAAADVLLRETIAPAVRELIAAGVADRWFFLRYADPGYHLRVRLHGDAGAITDRMGGLAQEALDTGLAHDAALATYHREVERYGGAGAIEIAEQVFHADSEAALALLERLERGEPGHEERWRLGVIGALALLRDFGVADPEAFARSQRAAFEHELGAGAPLRRAVARRAREHRTLLLEADPALAPGVAIIAERSERIAPLVAALHDPEAVVANYVHMWLNRLHRTDNQFHEYVSYALLAGALRPASVAR